MRQRPGNDVQRNISGTELILRLRFAQIEPLLGPGKIELLEAIVRDGSISAAGRSMRMSYHRAWTIVSEINAIFREPVIETQLGGVKGGGAVVTPLGRDIIRCYRSIETSIWKHAAPQIAALEALAQSPRPPARVPARRTAKGRTKC